MNKTWSRERAVPRNMRFSYPSGAFMGTLGVGGDGGGICTDGAGNVYIADNNDSFGTRTAARNRLRRTSCRVRELPDVR